MKSVELVFVLLTYRNEKDLIDFLDSAKEHVTNYAAIVVNSYYDDDSMNRINDVAERYCCDFINIENKGYGYGNNQGIAYANEHYNYEYVVVTNPDIIIRQYPKEVFSGLNRAVLAPQIVNRRGKMQNPMIWKNSSLADFLVYKGLKYSNKVLFYIGMGINKIIRETFYITHRKEEIVRIHQPHGSFIIFSKYVLDHIGMPFDENIFLFAEEGDLATILNDKKIPVYYVPQIKVYHKEDGSMQFRDDLDERLIAANVYVYEKHHKKG